jgi:mannose-6-phosphate isomerase-like protein (cupin superfamily)
VVPLHADSACSSFLICVPRSVPPHFHVHHTEHVSVLSGEGTMRLGDSTFTVAAGRSIVIPKGTVHAVVTTSIEPLRVISVQAPYFDGTDRVFVDP